MTDKPAESALDKAREEYAALRAALAPRNHVTHHTDCGCFTTAADALISALEAEVERLKCCGNCIHGSLDDFSFMCCRENDDSVPADWLGDVHVADPCHFTPSRWQRRQP